MKPIWGGLEAKNDGIGVRVKEHYFIDLFAGSGGLSLGLEQAGFLPILVNEINKSAMETYLLNRDYKFPWLREKYNVAESARLTGKGNSLVTRLLEGFKADFRLDVRQGDLDLLVGGPPCQGFSRIGHRRSHAAHRRDIPSNHLYMDMVEMIQELRPRMFLFENVVGLKTAKWSPNGTKGEVWEDIRRAFDRIEGYGIEDAVVHAKNYGVPQNRPRVLIVGVREDVPHDGDVTGIASGYLPAGNLAPPNLVDLLADLVDDDFENGGETDRYPHEPFTKLQTTMRTDPSTGHVYGSGERLTEHKYSYHNAKVLEKFFSMHESGGIIGPAYQTKKFSQRLLPSVWDDRGPYITITSLPDDYVHFSQPRTPTVREWARMQTFPDWYQFSGPRTTGGVLRAGQPRNGILGREVPKYTQIGNAVPVAMAREFGEHFMKILNYGSRDR